MSINLRITKLQRKIEVMITGEKDIKWKISKKEPNLCKQLPELLRG